MHELRLDLAEIIGGCFSRPLTDAF